MLQRYKTQFFDWLLLKDLRPNTLSNHKSQFRKLEDWFKDRPFNLETSKKFIVAQKAKGTKPGTIQCSIYTLRKFCEFLIERGVLEENFAKKINLPRRNRRRESFLVQPLSPEEIKKIIQVKRSYKHGRYKDISDEVNFFWSTLIELLAETGCRISELLNLQVEHLNLGEGSFTLLQTKTGNPRIVPIPPHLIPKLKKLTKDKSFSDLVFTSYRGKKLYNSSVNTELKIRAELAGVKKRVYCHLLRHSFITTMLTEGVSILEVAEIVGHENLNTTQGYTHLVLEHKKKAQLRHPLVRQGQSVSGVLERIRDTIRSLRLEDDPRFKFHLKETKNSLEFKATSHYSSPARSPPRPPQ